MKKALMIGAALAAIGTAAYGANFFYTVTGEQVPASVVFCATASTYQGIPIAIPCPSGQTNMANSTSVTVAYDQTPVQVMQVPGRVGGCQPNFLTKQTKPWPFCY